MKIPKKALIFTTSILSLIILTPSTSKALSIVSMTNLTKQRKMLSLIWDIIRFTISLDRSPGPDLFPYDTFRILEELGF